MKKLGKILLKILEALSSPVNLLRVFDKLIK